jgi:hypothetical protein
MSNRSKRGQSRQSAWNFYWTRPIGATEHHFRLSLTTHPLWGCKHFDVASLSSEIAASRPCQKLEVIIAHDDKSQLPPFVAENDWDMICATLGTYHGSSLASLRFVGLTQEQMMRLIDSFKGRSKERIQHIEIALSNDSNEIPGQVLHYLRQHVSSLQELHLLDPGRNVLLLRLSELRDFIESAQHLRLLVVEPRIVVTASDDPSANRDLDLLVYTIQHTIAFEHVVLSFACAGQRPSKPIAKPKTLADLLKEPHGVTRRKETAKEVTRQDVICPEILSVSKDKLQFALACNAFCRELTSGTKVRACGNAEAQDIFEAGLRVLKDWMNQNGYN